MGYQALLFCPDEKLARVVSQVFSELDFTIDHVQEPFSAVKRLMAQRFDAVVVDCENETNAALLFKSARNSTANQGSLAIAVVEGQAGVAKAYRIGANLVLTKPINVEQAKGTLRVARGLLRKTSDASTLTNVEPPASPATAVAAPASPVAKEANRRVEAGGAPVKPSALPEFETPLPAMAASAMGENSPVAAPAREVQVNPQAPVAVPIASAPVKAESVKVKAGVPANQSALPEFEAPLPAMAASAKGEDKPGTPPAREGQEKPPVTVRPVAEDQPRSVSPPVKAQAAPAASMAPQSPASPSSGAAAAPAPAKSAPIEKTTVEFEAAYHADDRTPPTGSASAAGGPSFAALDIENAGDSTGSKKILIAVAAVLILAALAFVGWSKLSAPKSKVASPAASAPQPPSQQATPPSAVPMSAPVSSPGTGSTNRADAITSGGTSRNVAVSAAAPAAISSPVPRISVNPESVTKKTDAAPIVVKSTPAKPSPGRTEETVAALPSPLAVAESSDSGLSSLTVPSTQSQPSLAKVNISQGVSQGLLIKRVQPKYPQNALIMHLQGSVQLEATIDKEGNITKVSVLKGDATLARAAMDAVRQWRYKPYYLDGVPVEIQTQITINFKLPN